MINQKEISKQYKHLNSKFIEVYIGRIKSIYKTPIHELSLYKKTNEYGDFENIIVMINKTHFNGTYITMFVDFINSNYKLFREFQNPQR